MGRNQPKMFESEKRGEIDQVNQYQVNELRTAGGLPMQENHLDVDIFAIFVQKVLEKVRHRLVGDMSAHDDVPVRNGEVGS